MDTEGLSSGPEVLSGWIETIMDQIDHMDCIIG